MKPAKLTNSQLYKIAYSDYILANIALKKHKKRLKSSLKEKGKYEVELDDCFLIYSKDFLAVTNNDFIPRCVMEITDDMKYNISYYIFRIAKER